MIPCATVEVFKSKAEVMNASSYSAMLGYSSSEVQEVIVYPIKTMETTIERNRRKETTATTRSSQRREMVIITITVTCQYHKILFLIVIILFIIIPSSRPHALRN